jgi:hypothetical protein
VEGVAVGGDAEDVQARGACGAGHALKGADVDDLRGVDDDVVGRDDHVDLLEVPPRLGARPVAAASHTRPSPVTAR